MINQKRRDIVGAIDTLLNDKGVSITETTVLKHCKDVLIGRLV